MFRDRLDLLIAFELKMASETAFSIFKLMLFSNAIALNKLDLLSKSKISSTMFS